MQVVCFMNMSQALPDSALPVSRGSDEFPELKDMQTLPLQELGVRLCYKYVPTLVPAACA